MNQQPNPYEQPAELPEPSKPKSGWLWLFFFGGLLGLVGVAIVASLLYTSVEQTTIVAPNSGEEVKQVDGPDGE